jgi:hypothetical protein
MLGARARVVSEDKIPWPHSWTKRRSNEKDDVERALHTLNDCGDFDPSGEDILRAFEAKTVLASSALRLPRSR